MECAICKEIGGTVVLQHGCSIGSTHYECLLPHIERQDPRSGPRRPRCPHCRKHLELAEVKLIKVLAEKAKAERADGSGNTIPDPACLQQPADAAPQQAQAHLTGCYTVFPRRRGQQTGQLTVASTLLTPQ